MNKTAERGRGQSSTGQRLVIASKALRGQNVLLLADGDLLGGAVHLTADTFGDLLDFPTGFQEGFDLCVDRGAGFHGWSRLGFSVGCFYAHDGHLTYLKINLAAHCTRNT